MSLFRYAVIPSRQFSRYARPFRREYFPLTSMLNDMQRLMRAFDDDFFTGDRYVRRQPDREEAQPTEFTKQQASNEPTTTEQPQASKGDSAVPAANDAPTNQVTRRRRNEQSVRAWDPFDFDFGAPSLFPRVNDLVPAWAHREFESFNPRFDVVEEDKQYRVAVEVPGVRKEDLKIRLGQDGYSSRTLTISGERRNVWQDDAEPAQSAPQAQAQAQGTAEDSKASESKTDAIATASTESSKRTEQSRVRGVSYGSFSRTISLPDDVDVQSISAKQENGILRLVLPKLEQPAQKEHEISIQ